MWRAWTTEPAGAKGLQPSVQPTDEAAGLPKGLSPAGPRLGGKVAWARGQRWWHSGMPRADCTGASRVRENRMHGSERGGWKRGTVVGPPSLQATAWTAPDLLATAPASYSTPL